MKIKLEIELDVPGVEAYSEPELRQLMFDAYINYVTQQHMMDAVRWHNKDAIIAEYHSNWGEIASQATWEIKT